MNQPLRSPLLLLSLAIAACGGNNNADNTPTNTVTAPSGGERTQPAAAPDDVSEVAAPNELVALVRTPSLREVVARVSGLGALPEAQVNAGALALVGELLGNGELVRVVRTDRAMDGAVVFAGGRPAVVFSVSVPAPAETARQLGNAFRTRPLGNGVLELTAQPAQQSRGKDMPPVSASPEDATLCFVSPTPTPGEGRLTCTNGARTALERVTPYLARTLTRREVRADAIVAQVFPTAVRATFGADATRAFEETDRTIDREMSGASQGPMRHAEVRQPIARLLHEIVGNLRGVWSETQAVELALSFDDRRVRLVGNVDLQNPTGSFVRAMVDGARSAPPLPEQHLQRISTNSAIVLSGTLAHQAFSPYIAPLREISVALARQEARLPPALVTQLETAITHFGEMDVSVVAGAEADAQGRALSVSVARYTDAAHATQAVADTRSLMALLRNATLTRSVDTLLRQLDARQQINWRLVRDLPTTGLPAGSYAFQIPKLDGLITGNSAAAATPEGARRRPAGGAAATAANAADQYLMVPDGAYITVVHGRDVRAQWAEVARRTGAPLDLQLHGARAGALSMSLLPAGIPNTMLLATDPDRVRNAERARAVVSRMPDHGATPITLRMSNAPADSQHRFVFELEVQTATITGLAAGLR